MRITLTTRCKNQPVFQFIVDERRFVTGAVCIPAIPESQTIHWTIELPDGLKDTINGKNLDNLRNDTGTNLNNWRII